MRRVSTAAGRVLSQGHGVPVRRRRWRGCEEHYGGPDDAGSVRVVATLTPARPRSTGLGLHDITVT